MGRFLNADTQFDEAAGFVGNNLFAYCANNPVMYKDESGTSAINAIFATIGAIAGWALGDYVAKQLGYTSGTKYWLIRAGVTAGAAVVGWFAGSLMTKILASYLRSNPAIIFRMVKQLGASKFYSIMVFLGINPYTLAMDSSKFIAIARLFNSKTITLGYDWAVALYNKAKELGFEISVDPPHGDYGWHIHISGANGKLANLHIQIVKAVWDYLSGLLK